MGKSHDLARGASSLYQTQSASDTRYVNTTGDGMTGNLGVGGAANGSYAITSHSSGGQNLRFENDNEYAFFRLQDNGDLQIWAHGDDNINLMNGTGSGTTRMNIDGSGRVTMPYQPSFYGYPSSNVTITLDGSWTTVNFGSTGWNTGNHYNTSNSRFTAPVAGKYLITWMWQLENANVADWIYFYPRVNGVNGSNRSKGISFADFRNEATYHTENGSWIVNLAVNDYVDIFVRGTGGDKSFKDESHWSMVLIG